MALNDLLESDIHCIRLLKMEWCEDLAFGDLGFCCFSGGSIFEMFKNAPNLKVLTDLMNEMPELMETLIYQNSQEPQRVRKLHKTIVIAKCWCLFRKEYVDGTVWYDQAF